LENSLQLGLVRQYILTMLAMCHVSTRDFLIFF